MKRHPVVSKGLSLELFTFAETISPIIIDKGLTLSIDLYTKISDFNNFDIDQTWDCIRVSYSRLFFSRIYIPYDVNISK